MAIQQLLSSFGKKGSALGLLTMKVDIEDPEHLSKYFVISEYNPLFSAGRNPVAFNGSIYLEDRSEIKVECLDSHGNSLYIEQAKSVDSQFTDISKFVISVHIYDETYNGPGKLIFVGTTKKGEIVRWIGKITIDKTLTNFSKVRFYSKPTLEARPLLYPVVDVAKASKDVPPIIYSFPTTTAVLKGIVYSISITNGGAGYTAAPTVTIAGGATATSIIDVNGVVTSITVTDGGSGYSSSPSVTITPSDAGIPTTPAAATANITNIVDSVTIIDGGSGYTVIPTITFLGVGSGASAVATILDGKVNTITVTNGGSGYTTSPVVNFSDPKITPAPILNVPCTLSSSFYAYAVNPKSNTNALKVDRKRTDIDYRLVATGFSDIDIFPSVAPTGSFNTQMEGSLITLNVKKILLPPSQIESDAIESNIPTKIFTIKKVIDSKTIILNDSFYYQIGKDQIITDIFDATFTSSYNYILYNTNAESNLKYYADATSTGISAKQSYAEITYRNLKTYSGFVARHKLYRRSLFHPGDFQLISDEPLGEIELLADIITFNKAYTNIGTFYNQFHTDKYWNPSDPSLISVTAKTFPINSGYIHTSNPIDMDGTRYVIVKTDSIGIPQDNVYYSYNETEFNDLTGTSYNSNFISLKKDILYSLSTNITMEKNFSDTLAKVSFYFTSSIPEIKLEKDFNPAYGLKLGEIFTKDQTEVKYFDGKQVLYFTPKADYFGTLVIVPYHCNVTLSEVSLKVYGDYGFSPDILFIRIPFPINISGEAFELKAELFDINSLLIFSDLKITKTFDRLGGSLTPSNNLSPFVYIAPDPVSPSNNIVTIVSSFTVTSNMYLPNLQLADKPFRLVGWVFPDGSPDSNKLVYTPVSDLSRIGEEYINLTTVNGVIPSSGRSIAVRYTSSTAPGGAYGKRVSIDLAGTKTIFS